MALISCPECGKEVSDKAKACPNCGFGVVDFFNPTSEPVAPTVPNLSMQTPVYSPTDDTIEKSKKQKNSFRVLSLLSIASVVASLFIPFMTVSVLGVTKSQSIMDVDGKYYLYILAFAAVCMVIDLRFLYLLAAMSCVTLAVSDFVEVRDIVGASFGFVKYDTGYYVLVVASILMFGSAIYVAFLAFKNKQIVRSIFEAVIIFFSAWFIIFCLSSENEILPDMKEDTYLSTDQIDSNLKNLLDSYESFVDDNVRVLEEYKNKTSINSSDLQQYYRILMQYADYIEQLDAIDVDKLSATEAYYYDQIIINCKKLLEDAGLGDIDPKDYENYKPISEGSGPVTDNPEPVIVIDEKEPEVKEPEATEIQSEDEYNDQTPAIPNTSINNLNDIVNRYGFHEAPNNVYDLGYGVEQIVYENGNNWFINMYYSIITDEIIAATIATPTVGGGDRELQTTFFVDVSSIVCSPSDVDEMQKWVSKKIKNKELSELADFNGIKYQIDSTVHGTFEGIMFTVNNDFFERLYEKAASEE